MLVLIGDALPFGSMGGLVHVRGSHRCIYGMSRRYPRGMNIRESSTEDILRAMLCTRVYTVVYTQVHYCVHTCILTPPR